MKTQKILVPFGAALLTILALAGCSGTGTPTATNSASPSATPSAAPTIEIPKKTAECVNGVAKVTENNVDVTIAGDCATVDVTASNTLVNVGKVKSLSISGSINKVTAVSVDKVTFSSDGNIVVAGNTPEVDDNGKQNEVQSK